MDAPPETPADKKEVKGRKLPDSIALSLAAVGFGLSLMLPYVVAQVAAIGFGPAWAKYYKVWLGGIAICLGFGLAVILGFAIGPRVKSLLKKVIPFKFFKFLLKPLGLLFNVAVFVTLFLLLFKGAYDRTKQDYYKFQDITSGEVADISQAGNKQSESLKQLSTRAKELINQLEATEALIQDNKNRLANTLTDIAKQVNAVEEANTNMASLAERQKQIELRASELERILEGQAPITKKDLDDSARWGWIQGVSTSILATLIIVFVTTLGKRFLRRRESPSD